MRRHSLSRPVARVIRLDLGLVIQDYVQQGVMDFQSSIVFNILHSAPSSRTTLGLVGGELLAWTVDGGWY